MSENKSRKRRVGEALADAAESVAGAAENVVEGAVHHAVGHAEGVAKHIESILTTSGSKLVRLDNMSKAFMKTLEGLPMKEFQQALEEKLTPDEMQALEKEDDDKNEALLHVEKFAVDVRRDLASARSLFHRDGKYEWAAQRPGDLLPPYADYKLLPKSEHVFFGKIFGGAKLFLLLNELVNLGRKHDGTKFDSLAEYADQALPDFATLASERPKSWWDDENFGYQRLNGVNPALVTVVKADLSNLPGRARENKDKIDAGLDGGATLKDLAAKGALWCMDYSILESKDIRVDPTDNRFLPISTVLLQFDRASNKLKPFWIHVSNASGEQNSFVPSSGKGGWAWRYAKSCVQASEWNYHEIGAHLTWTHLVEEVFCVATGKKLKADHPIRKLLFSHFVRTLSLNKQAREKLVPGALANLAGVNEEGIKVLIRKFYDDFTTKPFQSHYLPNNLTSRGFDPKNLPPTYYYALDAVRIWDATRVYVAEYVAVSFGAGATGDKAIADSAANGEIQGWVDELAKVGQIRLPPITNAGVLTDVLTFIIFNASVQHSAVNYLQQYYMAYSAAFPGAIFGRIPQNSLDSINEEFLCHALPGSDSAKQAVAISMILSQTVKSLQPFLAGGGPPPFLEAMTDAAAKYPAAMKQPLVVFSKSIQELCNDINKRNAIIQANKGIPYAILNPVDNVANSIQI